MNFKKSIERELNKAVAEMKKLPKWIQNSDSFLRNPKRRPKI